MTTSSEWLDLMNGEHETGERYRSRSPFADDVLGGMRIVESPFLTESGEPTDVWVPCGGGWKVKRRIVPQVPMKEAIRIGNTLYMHPVTYREFKRQLEGR